MRHSCSTHTSVDLMASDDHDERLLRGALAELALVTFFTYEKRHRARTLAEWALVLDVLEDMETAEGEESGDGDSPRVKRTWRVHPRSDFSRAPWSTLPRKPELKQRDSRENKNFRRHFGIPHEFLLELVQLAKHRKWFSLAARDVAGRQCIPVVLKDSRSCC